MRGKTEQIDDAGGWIVRRCKNSEWQRAVDRQHVTGLLAPDVDLREGDKAAVEVVYVAVGIGDPDRRTAGGEFCPIVVTPRRRIVGIEIDVRRVEITKRRGQCVAIDPVGRVADEGEQLGRGSVGRPCIGRIVEADRDRVDAEREAGRQGRGVVIGRIAGDGAVAVRKIDDIQDRRARRIALIGDDLVTGIIEIETRQRDDRTSGNRGGRRVGDRSFARPESAAGQPAIVCEIDDGACLDVTREDEREGVCGAAVVLNDGDVADRQNGSHQAASRSLEPANRTPAPARYSAASAQKRPPQSQDRLVPQADRVSLVLIYSRG